MPECICVWFVFHLEMAKNDLWKFSFNSLYLKRWLLNDSRTMIATFSQYMFSVWMGIRMIWWFKVFRMKKTFFIQAHCSHKPFLKSSLQINETVRPTKAGCNPDYIRHHSTPDWKYYLIGSNRIRMWVGRVTRLTRLLTKEYE